MNIGSKHSEETKNRMRLARLGKKIPDEVKNKIGISNKGKRRTIEAIEKIKIARSKQIVTKSMLDALERSRKARWAGHIPMMKDPVYASWAKNQWHHRRRNADGKHSYAEWETIKAQYNWTCPCCGKREPEIKLSVDHIIPLSKGGSNNIENIQPLCRLCNSKKNTKTIKYPLLINFVP